ncbi:TPA: hypothetical protein ACGOVN_000513 [Streptococcus suis]
MMTLRKVSENGFVIASDGAQSGLFGMVGIGWNVPPTERVEFGILLEGQTLKNVGWTVTIGAEDYSNPKVFATFTNPNFVVKEEETATSSTSSSETKNSEEQVSAKKQEPQKLFGILPMTGEIISVLGIVGLVFGGIVIAVARGKRRGE